MTRTMPSITRPYRTAAMRPDRTIIFGTSRFGLRISSEAPFDSSKPTHRNTRIPIAVRKPSSDGFRSPTVDAPAGLPCLTRKEMNNTVKIATTAIFTNVPMFGPHLPTRNAMIAIATVTQMNASPTTTSQAVLIGLLRTKASSDAIVAALSVPPTQSGLDSQYRIAVTAPAGRPNAILAHSYGPPSTGNAEPSSAVSMPYGIRNTTSDITNQVIACAPASAANATLSRPTIAHAVNSTRSRRPSTRRSLAFSWMASDPSGV